MSGEADGTALIAEEQAIPTWRPRSYLTEETPVGKPYRWNGQVYRLWQQHDATGQPGWSPDLAFSLWDICHTTDPALAKDYLPPQGSRGLWQTGECCVFGGRVWRSRQDRNAYSPGELPGKLGGSRLRPRELLLLTGCSDPIFSRTLSIDWAPSQDGASRFYFKSRILSSILFFFIFIFPFFLCVFSESAAFRQAMLDVLSILYYNSFPESILNLQFILFFPV